MSWELLERTVYRIPHSPPRRRTAPMQVLCVGLPRTGTESLQQALLTLGYDHTYHGWDILFEAPLYSPGWVGLARRKFNIHRAKPKAATEMNGDCDITTAEFDTLLGHCTAVTDAAGSVFAAELIRAYPDAKVVLNVRRDEEAWYQSVCQTILDHSYCNSTLWFASFFCSGLFWGWHVYHRFLWAGMFRSFDGNIDHAVRNNARWVYREHNAMIRGLVPAEKLLEWSVEDGWEPLCKFLDKDVPKEDFPHANTRGEGWAAREEQATSLWVGTALRNLAIIVGSLALGGVLGYRQIRQQL